MSDKKCERTVEQEVVVRRIHDCENCDHYEIVAPVDLSYRESAFDKIRAVIAITLNNE